jgi:uncharacterized membrane protein YgdD (TMEM256/DUF423 family)
MARKKRPNRLAVHLHPVHIFVTGILVIACFLLQQNLVVRVVQVALFAGIVMLSGKRIRFGYFIIMVTSITVFNLLTPVGEVLLTAGPIVITRGALRQGLMKGFAIPGLVFISLFAVRPDLRLPGRFGGLIARLFFYFEHLLEGRKRIQLKRFVDSIDEVLMDLLEETAAGKEADPVGPPAAATAAAAPGGVRPVSPAMSPSAGTTAIGYLFVTILAASSVAAVVLFGTF